MIYIMIELLHRSSWRTDSRRGKAFDRTSYSSLLPTRSVAAVERRIPPA